MTYFIKWCNHFYSIWFFYKKNIQEIKGENMDKNDNKI